VTINFKKLAWFDKRVQSKFFDCETNANYSLTSQWLKVQLLNKSGKQILPDFIRGKIIAAKSFKIKQ